MRKKKQNRISPIHPGEILREEYMLPLKLTQYRVSKATQMAPVWISGLVHEKRSITPESAMRLGRLLGTSAEFWLNLQVHYDLAVAKEKLEKKIETEVAPLAA